jgi:hypothetical protein
MDLKSKRDYVDCELIHKLVVGTVMNNKYIKVIGFTCDDGQTIINRIQVYKSMIAFCINKLYNPETSEKYKETMKKWQQGILVICNTDGAFMHEIKVDEIRLL